MWRPPLASHAANAPARAIADELRRSDDSARGDPPDEEALDDEVRDEAPGGDVPDDEVSRAPEHALGALPSREEAHLALHLQRFSFCLERHAARHAETPPPDVDGEDLVSRIGREIDALDDYLDENYPDDDLPIMRVCRQFALDGVALRLLLAAAAPALDLSLARLLDSITGRMQPDVGLLVAATTRNLVEERAALAALRAGAPMVRRRLVRLGVSRDWSPETPLLHRPVMVPDRVVEWLRGEVTFDPERFERAAVLWSAAAPDSEPRATGPAVRALFREDSERRPPVVVAGPERAGKAAAVHAAADARGLPVLDVDLDVVASSSQPVDLLLDLVREAVLQDAVLLLRRADGLRDQHAELRRAVASVLTDGALWTALTTRGEWRDDARRIPGAQLVDIGDR